MTKNWNLYEKIISTLQIVWGLIIIVFLTRTVHSYLEPIIKDFDVSFFKIFKNHHFVFFSGLLGVISGILLLKSKKIGWIMSVASWIIYSTGIILIGWKDSMNEKELFEEQSDYFVVITVIIFFCVLGFSLLTKPFRIKYKANISAYIIIGLIILVFALDKILID